MNRKTKIFLPLIIAISIAVGIFLGTSLNYQKKTITFFGGTPQERKIKRLIDYIQYEYVDEVDTDSLLDGTIKNMLAKLDPHSVYISAEQRKKVKEDLLESSFEGIGVEFRIKDDIKKVPHHKVRFGAFESREKAAAFLKKLHKADTRFKGAWIVAETG